MFSAYDAVVFQRGKGVIRREHLGGMRSDVAAQLARQFIEPGAVLLTGPRGSGRSHTLTALAAILEAADIASFSASASEPGTAELLTREPLRSIHIIDDLEDARPEVIAALSDRVLRGGRGVGAMIADHAPSSATSTSGGLEELLMPAGDAPMTRYVHLKPLTLHESFRLIADAGVTTLDASTLAAIHELSWGRPGWLMELVHLATQDAVLPLPWPSVSAVRTRELGLATYAAADEVATATLSPEEIAGAAVLARLEPRTLVGYGDLLGPAVVAQLVAHGVLIPSTADGHLHAVPELFAAPMRLRADPSVVARCEELVAGKLMLQEALGIPLTDREAYFCTTASAGSPRREELDPVRAKLFHRVALNFLSFGESGKSRDILMRGAAFGMTLSSLDRSRAATAFHGTLDGLRSVQAASEPQSDAEAIARVALSHQLVAELALTQQRRDRRAAPDPPASESIQSANLLFARWNDAEPLGRDAAALRSIARTHDVPVVGLLADQLLDIEQLRDGHTPRDPAPCVERIVRVTEVAMGSEPEHRDLLAAAAVAEGLLALYLGDNAGSELALDTLCGALAGTALHRAWLRHLGAVGQAIASGDIARAYREWRLVEACLPRFLPTRLSALVRATGDAIAEAAGHGQDAISLGPVADVPTQFLAYFGGQIDRIVRRSTQYRLLHGAPDEPHTLLIARLARAHVHAANAQNPNALLQSAEQLTAHGFWAPAAYALHEAQRIFVRRRATGSVNRCAALLDELAAAATAVDPWFRLDALPRAEYLQLTARESTISQLVMEGLRNREIAARLRCSVRTVESHIAQARAKLGAADRGQLAELMREFALPESERAQQERRRRVDSRLIDHMR